MEVLKSTKARGIRIEVICTESRPTNRGEQVKAILDEQNIPCKCILDSSVGLVMASGKVDAVFVGAEAVLENGGIVNRVGTLTLALVAKAYNKPFYVFAETFKFFKRFPLCQSDVFDMIDEDRVDTPEEKTDEMNTKLDYTPPEYISEFFTDIGIYTPPAVSDEIITFF